MADSVLTWAQCVRIVRSDATVIALTEHDRPIVYDGVTYEESVSYTPSAVDSTGVLSVNNGDIKGFFSVAGLEKADLVAGLYDNAEVYFLIIDYSDNTLVRALSRGYLGEVNIKDNSYTVEYRSLSQKLQQTIGRNYIAECDAKLGDARCGVNLASFTYTGSITSVTSNQVFVDSALIGTQTDDYYNYGLVTFTSGLNNGLSKEVKDYNDATGQITTFLPFPYAVATSDTFTVYAGCDKRKTTCINTFNNVVNFRGFDMIPGNDKIQKIGGQ